MISLGIESTAHTLGIGIVRQQGSISILADQRAVFQPEAGKGIHPMLAAEHHESKAGNVLEAALRQSSLSVEDIDIISYAAGPGLPPCLKVGWLLAEELSKKHGKPLVRVNHATAHYEIARHLTGMRNPVFLYVSGGNTQVIAVVAGNPDKASSEGSSHSSCFRVFGETQDISIGNCLDTFARSAGLPFPGGPAVESLALKSKNYIQLPYSVKGMDVSFSGLLTAAEKALKKHPLEDVCFSLQETAFAMLAEISERAMAQLPSGELMASGGVAASARLSSMLSTMCRERGASFAACPKEYAGDNGVMIALAGLKMYKQGKMLAFDFNPRWRIDEVS